MANLLTETVEVLQRNGKTLADIVWFGKRDCSFEDVEIDELLKLAYNDNWGCAEVDLEFILVGEDFWLQRREYDGMEWWEYNTYPLKPVKKAKIEKSAIPKLLLRNSIFFED